MLCEEQDGPGVGGPLAVRGDVRGAAAVAVGGLGSLDVQVQQLHLQAHKQTCALYRV